LRQEHDRFLQTLTKHVSRFSGERAKRDRNVGMAFADDPTQNRGKRGLSSPGVASQGDGLIDACFEPAVELLDGVRLIGRKGHGPLVSGADLPETEAIKEFAERMNPATAKDSIIETKEAAVKNSDECRI